MSIRSNMEAPKLSEKLVAQLKTLTFDEMRVAMGIFLRSYNGGQQLWDLITGLRGPDSPSETPSMGPEERDKAYKGRRDRKFKSTEIIRNAAFFGVVGGAARYHKGNSIKLPPSNKWDHFDKHMSRAASVIGLGVDIEK